MQERVIGHINPGHENLLIIMAAIHGNELAGIKAANRFFELVKNKNWQIDTEVIALVGNLAAVRNAKRFIDRDLNRQWTKEKIYKAHALPLQLVGVAESKEQAELIEIFQNLDFNSRKRIVLLDLHTTSADGGLFSIANSHTQSAVLAKALKVPVIKGITRVLKGTTLQYFDDLNLAAIGFEAGQHEDPRAVDNMEAAMVLLLRALNCLYAAKKEDVSRFEQLLSSHALNKPAVVVFKYRFPISKEDLFEMQPGYKNFQTIQKDELLAIRNNTEEIRAKQDGLILMPLYQKQGEDGFFIVEKEE